MGLNGSKRCDMSRPLPLFSAFFAMAHLGARCVQEFWANYVFYPQANLMIVLTTTEIFAKSF